MNNKQIVQLIEDQAKEEYREYERHSNALLRIRLDYERRIEIARTLRADWRSGVVLCAIATGLGLRMVDGPNAAYRVGKRYPGRRIGPRMFKLIGLMQSDGLISAVYYMNEKLTLTAYGREIVAAMSADRDRSVTG